MAFIATASGEVFKTNNNTKVLEEVKLVNGGGLTNIQMSSDGQFCIASGVNNCI